MNLTTGSLAQTLEATLIGPADVIITGAETLDAARAGHIAFIRSSKFAKTFAASQASAALVLRGIEKLPEFASSSDVSQRALLVVDDVEAAMAAVLQMLMPEPTRPAAGAHATAIVDSTASIDPQASIGAYVTIGPRCKIQQGCIIHAGVRIAADVTIGPGTEIHPNVVIGDRTRIGTRCIVYANVVIGADGFGYYFDKKSRRLCKVPHIGHVEIADDVEIGAGTCIDRGKFGATTIASNAKIDNLVQIAHNCHIGRSVIICGCAGIAGSVTIGDGAMIGGAAGIIDNITIGARAKIAACAGVMNDVAEGETVVGSPAVAHRQWAREQIAVRRLTRKDEPKQS